MGVTMISNPHVWRCAGLLIKRHRDDTAAIYAAMRAARSFAEGDLEGAEVWLQIGRAVNELLATHRPGDMNLH